jgi:putative CocE/NonD family hydrolase
MSTERATRSDIQRHDDLLIPVESEMVAATRYEPVDIDGPAPVLLMQYPYRKDDHLTFGAYSPTIEYLAAHGYNVVTADLIGTGASSGRKERPGKMPDEGIEGAAVVEWLADQSWSTGRVGMFGKSYAGSTCLKTAAQQPDALDAIIPMFTSAGGYPERYGGIVDAWGRGGHWNPQMQALQGLPSSYRDDDGRWAEVWQEHLAELEEGEPWLFQEIDNEEDGEYWARKEVNIDRIKVPTFGVSGYRDFAPASTFAYLETIDAPTRGLIGPWRHTMGHRGREVAVDMRRQAVEWFDHFLKDVDNAAEEHAPIEYWTERNGGGKVNEGIWRRCDRWPDISASTINESLSFAASPAGLIETDQFDTGELHHEYEHDHTVGMRSVDMGFPVPADTNEDDVRSLTFETEPLANPIEYTGTGRATVRLTSIIKDPLLVVRVVDVAPDGEAGLVSHGRLRLSHRKGHANSEPLEPGEEYEVTVPLKPKSHVFEEGHRIRLAISAAFFPMALPPRKQGAYVIHSSAEAPTLLEFPGRVHNNGVSFDDAFEMADPDTKYVGVEPEYVTPMGNTWSTSREHTDDTATIRTTSGKLVDLPHGGEMTFEQDIEAVVAASDPDSAYVESTTMMTVDNGTEMARAEITCHASRDTAQYTTHIRMNDQTVFKKTFRH